MRDLPVSAVCLPLIAAHPELSERDAVEEELPGLRLSAETECGTKPLAWRRSCRSTIRHGPKLFPLERARSRRVRDRFRYKQIATAAKSLVLSVAGFHPVYSHHCGRSDPHGHRYARSYKSCRPGGFL